MATREQMAKYHFDEKQKELYRGITCRPVVMDKYKISREFAVDLIESNKYGLVESDFWTLKTYNIKEEKCFYSGLIISHNGCLKINDKLDSPFKEECCSEPIPYEYLETKGYRQIYREGGLYEVGEISNENLKNSYPFAMLFKRLFDRVVLKKSKLAFSGIYSESESEEFEKKETRQSVFDEEIKS